MLIANGTYEIIKKSMPIPCVDLIVVNGQNEILMLKRTNDPAKGEWWFPGGRVHFNETRIEAVMRKLKQECGLEAKKIQEIGTTDLILENSDNTLSHAITTVYKVEANGDVIIDEQSRTYAQKTPKEWLSCDIHIFLKDMLIKNFIITKKAIVVGAYGQDGAILSEQLTANGFSVIKIGKNKIESKELEISSTFDILDSSAVCALINRIRPEQIYYLAAYHNSSEDIKPSEYELFEKSVKINNIALMNFLEAIKIGHPESKLFYAASSHIFGNIKSDKPLDEETKFMPNNIYAITKLSGLNLCKYYRSTHNIFASVGILFNHESVYRNEKFLSKKISKGIAQILKGKQTSISLGNLDSKIDWGYAPDFVNAMQLILNLNTSDEFIIATGEAHSVKEFVQIAFNEVGLNYQNYITLNSEITPVKHSALIGDAGKLKNSTGWSPSIGFEEMVRKLVNDTIKDQS